MSPQAPRIRRCCPSCGRSFVPYHRQAYCSVRCQREHWREEQRHATEQRPWTAERIVRVAIEFADDTGFGPHPADWVLGELGGWPSIADVLAEFGSWHALIAAAGVPAPRTYDPNAALASMKASLAGFRPSPGTLGSLEASKPSDRFYARQAPS